MLSFARNGFAAANQTLTPQQRNAVGAFTSWAMRVQELEQWEIERAASGGDEARDEQNLRQLEEIARHST